MSIQIASQEFVNTAEEGRITIAKSDVFLQQGNTSKALDTLSAIKPDQAYYLQSKTKMANIYLKYRKDRLLFAQCFKELVQNCPGPDSYLMLGDAYMSIQGRNLHVTPSRTSFTTNPFLFSEPDDAINAYKKAFKENPSDPMLASKLGRAYVRTHQYKKAITYYLDATTSPENYALKLDLAELFLKLKKFPEAEQTLRDEIDATER
jgi:tetratricopeptide repeat protein 21B